jgi:GcrA cell cycle regulator
MALSASLIEQVYALRRAGWAYSEIARKVGISRGSAAGLLDRARKAGQVFPERERSRRKARERVSTKRAAPADPVAATPFGADAPAEHHHQDHHDDDARRRISPPEAVDPALYEPRLIRRGGETIYEVRVPLGRKSVFQLREGDCRFPFGDTRQGGVSFCGEPALEGRSWCRAHAEIVYRPKEGARRG